MRALRGFMRYRLIVTLKTGVSFDGILFHEDRQALVLRDVKALNPDAKPVPVDGELLVLLSDVHYVQRP